MLIKIKFFPFIFHFTMTKNRRNKLLQCVVFWTNLIFWQFSFDWLDVCSQWIYQTWTLFASMNIKPTKIKKNLFHLYWWKQRINALSEKKVKIVMILLSEEVNRKKTDWLIFYQLSKMSNVWNDVNFPYIKQFSEIQNLCKKAKQGLNTYFFIES